MGRKSKGSLLAVAVVVLAAAGVLVWTQSRWRNRDPGVREPDRVGSAGPLRIDPPALHGRSLPRGDATAPSARLRLKVVSFTGVPATCSFAVRLDSGGHAHKGTLVLQKGVVTMGSADPGFPSVHGTWTGTPVGHLLLDMDPLAVGVLRLSLSPTDDGGTTLFGRSNNLRLVAGENEATIRLRVPDDQVQLMLVLKNSPLPLTQACFEILTTAGEILATPEAQVPRENARHEIQVPCIVPSGTGLVAQVSDYYPGQHTLGLPPPQAVAALSSGEHVVAFSLPDTVEVTATARGEAGELLPFYLWVFRVSSGSVGSGEGGETGLGGVGAGDSMFPG